jgi:2-methylcitrate dehydratase PrpD
MRPTRELAEFLGTLRYDDIPDDVRRLARLSLLDTVGVILAGQHFVNLESDQRLSRYVKGFRGDPAATILGARLRAPLFQALLANGTLAEVLDWQDSSMPARIHPCSGAIPAALAIAELERSSGKDTLTALVAGYEAGIRIGVAMQPSHWYGGFQATGTVGSLGAAVVAGKLMGFGPKEMQNALGTAGFVAPISNGDNVFHGYSVKPIHGGMAAQAGVQSALLVRAGYEAGPLEGQPPRHHGFMNVTSTTTDESHLSADLGRKWYMRTCSFKMYPAGLLNIGPIQLTQELMATESPDPTQIEKVDITGYKDLVHFTGGHYTNTGSSIADCQLSTPYAVAVTILDGTYGVDALLQRRIADPQIHALAAKVTVTEDPAMNTRYPDHLWPQTLTITMTSGHRISGRLDAPLGCPDNPATSKDLVPKFHTCADPVLGRERAKAFRDRALALEDEDRVADLIALTQPER